MNRFAIVVIGLALGSFAGPALSQEKPAPAAPVVGAEPSEEILAMASLLNTTVETKGLQEKVKLRTALEYFSDKFGGKLPILIDRKAFQAIQGPDSVDPYEEEVSLPPVPSRMAMSLALRLIISQVAGGEATYVVRKGYIEIVPLRRTKTALALREPLPFVAFAKKPLPNVLGELAEEACLAINLDPTIGKKAATPITATFRNCSVEEALVTVTEMAELKLVVLEHSIYVTTPERANVMRQEEKERQAQRKAAK